MKEKNVLTYQARRPDHVPHLVLSDILSVQKNSSAVHIIKAHQQFDHTAFPCAGCTHNSHCLSRMDLKGKIPKNLSSGTVLKRYVFKFISPLYILRIYIQAPVGKGFFDLKQGHNSAGAGHLPWIVIKRLSTLGKMHKNLRCQDIS